MNLKLKYETKGNCYDTDRMAEIIICLIERFGTDGLIKYLLDRLIRKESNSLVASFKSKKVVELEKEYNVSLSGLSRGQIYAKNKNLSKLIVIEHGLPEGQAIEMFFKNPNKNNVKIILEDIKKNIVYITKEEHNRLNKCWRTKGENGYYWEDVYKACNIELVKI
jgi:hypothetical protein